MRPLMRAMLLALTAGALLRLPGHAQEQHSLTGNVRALEARSHFVTSRAVQVYLPPDYDLSANRARRYPVFYLQDGQNVFDGATAFIKGKEWRADETAESLIRAGAIEPLIIVAIPNAGTARLDEYTPSPDRKYGGGGAARYSRFLTEELKPLVDRTFRTRRDPRDTGIGGASLGALVSLHLALRHPNTFQRVAVLSPSVWWNEKAILSQVAAAAKKAPPLRVYVDVGSEEPGNTVPDARLLRDALTTSGWVLGKNLFYREGQGDAHNEDAWAKRFPDVLRFLFPAAKKR